MFKSYKFCKKIFLSKRNFYGDRNNKIKKKGMYVDGLLSVMVCLSVAVVIYLLIQTAVVCTFRIPTDSMHPTLQPGDNILVNKSIMGARIFDILETTEDRKAEKAEHFNKTVTVYCNAKKSPFHLNVKGCAY